MTGARTGQQTARLKWPSPCRVCLLLGGIMEAQREPRGERAAEDVGVGRTPPGESQHDESRLLRFRPPNEPTPHNERASSPTQTLR